MRRSLVTAFCLSLFAFVATVSGFEWTGTWRMDQPRRGDVVLRTYFVLEQKGDTLDGKLVINNSVDLQFREPRFENGDFLFGTMWNMDFQLHPAGDKLEVSVKHHSGAVEKGIAVRAPSSEALPPAKVPLPAIEKLPYNGLAKTPPMGWSSWNHFQDRIDDKTVRECADALVSSGLAAAGYVYINIDDAWEGTRDADGRIQPNSKFPDMKALADYVHSKGLKFGLYSSPGPRTCGGYEGSYGYEELDAKTYAEWGVDYLKHDWCSAARVYTEKEMRAAYQKMGRALQDSGRPIVYSLCQYGMEDVWKWGPEVGANLWRTTGDIFDSWKSMSDIGFSQNDHAPYAGPGHWNDPDMLQVGNGGMTNDEYRTHFSLWCILAAPLMAGNDLRNMSKETLEILSNREAIAVDQDPLGKQGTRLSARDNIEVWTKPLHDGSLAVGIFNRGAAEKTGGVTWKELGLNGRPKQVRDLWAHKDLKVDGDAFRAAVPSHGVVFLRVK